METNAQKNTTGKATKVAATQGDAKLRANPIDGANSKSLTTEGDANWMDIAIDFLKENFPNLKGYEDRAKAAATIVVDSMKKKPLYTALGAIGVGIIIGVAVAAKRKE